MYTRGVSGVEYYKPLHIPFWIYIKGFKVTALYYNICTRGALTSADLKVHNMRIGTPFFLSFTDQRGNLPSVKDNEEK